MIREAAKRPQYARRAEWRVTDDAADVQRLQAQPAQADARHDASYSQIKENRLFFSRERKNIPFSSRENEIPLS